MTLDTRLSMVLFLAAACGGGVEIDAIDDQVSRVSGDTVTFTR